MWRPGFATRVSTVVCTGLLCAGLFGLAGTAGAQSEPTVSIGKVKGIGKVLVDANGAALYAAEQERNGKVVCTASCTAIWQPLTVAATAPTGEAPVAGKLGTVVRPGGDRQVTFGGRLLYRFAEDPDAGVVRGNGFDDAFDGRAFTWHVATPAGVSTTSANSSTGTPGY